MEQGFLNAAAQPFQPGGAPPRRNSAFSNPSPVPAHQNARQGSTYLSPHVLSQIQTQIGHTSGASSPLSAGGGGGGGGGGISPVPMSAQTRPFVPGGPASSVQYPHPSTSPVVPRAIPPRLGHALNPGSVQLTGLQTFLNGTGGIGMPMPVSPGAQPGMMPGPASPMTPGGVQPNSPFLFPAGQPAALGPNRLAKGRKGKGPAPITPLKTTGHNSTPSVSLNPAAFAASLAAAKAKKKVIVTIPKEGPIPADAELIDQQDELVAETEVAPDEDADQDPADEEKRWQLIKKRAALESAQTRQKWIRRDPLRDFDAGELQDVPEESLVSCAIHPEPWPSSMGLPDTIDIYLPGLSAWDEYREMRLEEKMAEEAEAAGTAFNETLETEDGNAGWHRDALGIQGPGHHSKSLSISSPADPNMVSFKLNRYLQSQASAEGDPNMPISDEAADKPVLAPFQENLPEKLREAFARRQAEAKENRAKQGLGHGYTMSLGLPNHGGPFGPGALSALEMIRAREESAAGGATDATRRISDAGPGGRPEGLADIAEANGQEDEEVRQGHTRDASSSKAPAWQDLARGFGYEPEDEDPPQEPIRRHSRHTSRISVATSRRAGTADEAEGDGELDEDDEIRTNPSEDADASDFEEEILSDADHEPNRAARWSHRVSAQMSDFGYDKRRGGGYADDLSDMSDDEDLIDSLTPSDEQYSNPSDEEAAREERMLRRQHHAERRAARHESRRNRARSGTNNTLPSSSIGEGDLPEQISSKRSNWVFPPRPEQYSSAGGIAAAANGDDIISNPSDEVQSDIDDSGTFGGPLDHHGVASGDRLSQDFRFPRPDQTFAYANGSNGDAHHNNGLPFQYRPPLPSTQTGTVGRSASGSMLNPGAKEFKFGAGSGAAANNQNGQGPHFRLPSINNSSFGGSSAFGDVTNRSQRSNSGAGFGLNAAAPSFTPGAFTFTAPGAPRLAMPENAAQPKKATQEGDQPGQQPLQGREKRQKFGPLDADMDLEEYPEPASPPRPTASTASIEGPLRDFGTLSRKGPPPFNPNGPSGQRTASGSRFKPDAPVFTPTWGRSMGLGVAAKRPGLPDFGFGATDAGPAPATSDFFAFNPGNKAINIRKPEEKDEDAEEQDAEVKTNSISAARAGADVPRNESDLAGHLLEAEPTDEDDEKENGADKTASAIPMEHLDPNRTPLASMWDRSNIGNGGGKGLRVDATAAQQYGRSPPIMIPGKGTDHIDTRISRVGHKHSLSRESLAMSLDGRHRRQAAGNGVGATETDDESLTDFIEELAERMDKALEGWAGKILDEVTIMGQVRPVHPPAADPKEREKMVEIVAQRVEQLLDAHTARLERTSADKESAADESQATVKTLANGADRANTSLDAHGELDFDYVQEVLDSKMQALKDELKSSFTEALATEKPGTATALADQAPHESESGVKLSPLIAEELASLLTARVSEALDGRVQFQALHHKQDLAAVLEPALEEHADKLHQKVAADRIEVAQRVADELHDKLPDWQKAFGDVRSSITDQIQMSILDGVVPHLEALRAEPVDPDVIAARVTEILMPMISDERERQRMERRASEESTKAPSITAHEVAEETMSRLLPVVSSLKSEPVDSDALVERLGAVIGKQSIEHLVDLDPVLALLEPLIDKQEDARKFSRQILDRQEEVEHTLSELPSAINAKTEIFLTTTSQTHEVQSSILSRLESLHELYEKSAQENRELLAQVASGRSEGLDAEERARWAEDKVRLVELEQQNKQLVSQLESARKEASQVRGELDEARNELSAAHEEHAAVRVDFAKLESRLAQAEKGSAEVVDELQSLRAREAGAADRAAAAEKERLAAEAAAREAVVSRDAAANEAALLKAHIDQLTTELHEARAERGRERESAAQATAEALARAERAEREAQRTAEARHAALERAGKAEGQLSALERRLAEQDTKVANLQSLTATQKQKTAQTQQRLAEKAREVEEYNARFAELEKDLIVMKDTLVGREELEAAQAQLAQAREEAASLKGQLAERERERERAMSSHSHSLGPGQDSGADTSREVEQDDGGWWS